jgi:hypothetical protein
VAGGLPGRCRVPLAERAAGRNPGGAVRGLPTVPYCPMNRWLAFLKTAGAALVPRLLGLVIALVGIYSFFFAEPTSHVVVINRELGVSGEVAVRSDSRGYRVYLDSSRVPYSFDEFTNEQLAPHQGLGYYLRAGDSVYKAPHATQLVLKRQGQASTWHLIPPRQRAP